MKIALILIIWTIASCLVYGLALIIMKKRNIIIDVLLFPAFALWMLVAKLTE